MRKTATALLAMLCAMSFGTAAEAGPVDIPFALYRTNPAALMSGFFNYDKNYGGSFSAGQAGDNRLHCYGAWVAVTAGAKPDQPVDTATWAAICSDNTAVSGTLNGLRATKCAGEGVDNKGNRYKLHFGGPDRKRP